MRYPLCPYAAPCAPPPTHPPHPRRQWDLLSLALLGSLLLGSAAVQLHACWPAGVLALLCFTPYFVDPQQ